MTFPEEIAAVASQLPLQMTSRLAGFLETVEGPTPLGLSNAKDLVGSPEFRDFCDRVWASWRLEPQVPGVAIALGLRAAAEATARQRRVVTIEPVVTGPSTWHIPLRQTTAVMLELIQAAREDLWLVSFAAYRVPELVSALSAAIDRGVRITLLLETAADSHGALSADAARAFRGLERGVRFCYWPADQRPALPAGSASMHAKALLIDRVDAFITSANFTGHALEHNLEMGVLTRGGDLAERLTRHFEALLAQQVLRLCGSR